MRHCTRAVVSLNATLAFVMCLAPVHALGGVQLNAKPIPEVIAPGQRVFLELSGTLPDGCAFGTNVEVSQPDATPGDHRLDVTIRGSVAEDTFCSQALSEASAAFGAFPFEPPASGSNTVPIRVVFERGETIRLTATTEVTVQDDPPETRPDSGVWWSPLRPGHGLSMESQGDRLFAIVHSYGPDGRPSWRTMLVGIEGSLATGEWQRFSGGNCLLCNEPFAAASASGDPVPAHFAFGSAREAWLRVGARPGPAIRVERVAFDDF